ncbi:MAG: hypothetical protein PHO10_06205 [Gemmiger sp.]|nr:hypothetical protein [Gemmiger sp.]
MDKKRSTFSKSGKCLLGGFLALLLLPWPLWLALRASLDTTNYENRALAPFPGTEVSAEAWPAAFEDWLGDHAPFRNQLMTLNATVNAGVGTLDSANVLQGQQGWLFLKDVSDSQSISDYQGLTAPTAQELADTAAVLQALDAALRAKGSRLAVVFAPAKEGVYSRYMPASVPVASRPTRVQALVESLRANTGVPIVYPQALLAAMADTQQVYYKYDTHWNEPGAWLAAQAVLEALGRDFTATLPPVAPAPETAPPKDLANMCAAWHLCTDDVYYTVAAPAATLTPGTSGEIQHYTGTGTDTLLLVRDSFGAALAPWLGAGFGQALVIHGNALTEEALQREQTQKTGLPDVVVLEVAERFYYTLPTRAATLLNWVS